MDKTVSQAGRYSNKMLDVIQNYIAEVFQDSPNPDRNFLSKCYVKDSSLDFYNKAFRSLLSDPMPVFSRDLNKVRPGHKKDPFSRNLVSNLSREGRRPPTLLIGGKGFGKTTFLNWTLKASDLNEKLQNIILIWIDFKEIDFSFSNFENALRTKITVELSENPIMGIDKYSKLEEIFRAKIEREVRLSGCDNLDDIKILKRNLVDEWRHNTEIFLDCLISYAIHHCKKQILIILDNADQKTFFIQKKVFEVSHQLTTRYPIYVIASLRESSYFRLCQTVTSDAFSQQQVFHIQAPALSAVLSQRFDYLAELIKKKATNFKSASGMEIKVSDLSLFVDLLRRSLLKSKYADQKLLFLSAMSNGSIRHSFQMIYDFLVSGHTKMEQYFGNYVANKKGGIPYHEFFTSVLLDGMAFFSETNSHLFLNIFSRSQNIDDSHFLRLRILKVIESLSKSNSFKPEDYVRIENLRERFQRIGVSRQTLEGHLKALLRFSLIVSNTQEEIESDKDLFLESISPISVHISACGKYYLEKIYFTFEYLSRIILDTPLFSDSAYKDLNRIIFPYQNRFFELPLIESLKASGRFYAYLRGCPKNIKIL